MTLNFSFVRRAPAISYLLLLALSETEFIAIGLLADEASDFALFSLNFIITLYSSLGSKFYVSFHTSVALQTRLKRAYSTGISTLYLSYISTLYLYISRF
jgi:hypothetical protein